MTKRTRILFALTAALLAVVMLFSVFYIAAESGHDCAGEDCRICRQIAICRDTLRLLTLAMSAAVFAVLSGGAYCAAACGRASAARKFTLVSLKVKLSD